jgi:hypothetical protein
MEELAMQVFHKPKVLMMLVLVLLSAVPRIAVSCGPPPPPPDCSAEAAAYAAARAALEGAIATAEEARAGNGRGVKRSGGDASHRVSFYIHGGVPFRGRTIGALHN